MSDSVIKYVLKKQFKNAIEIERVEGAMTIMYYSNDSRILME